MNGLLAAERDLYQGLWSSVPSYGDHSPGEQHLPIFLQIVGDQRGTVLDAGAGSGKGALALEDAGFLPILCDVTNAGLGDAKRLPFAEASLWDDLTATFQPVKWVYCTDVLEHIPPQFTMLAVHQMLNVCTEGLFLTISLVPDEFGSWAGKTLHQSIFPFTWWRESLSELGDVVEARDLIHNGVFFVRPQ